ncbi:MAG: SPOR domain-containing protein [Planctomycetes bacterium]|nr:SPOR domain-containing protein [Planctomycetota bacterium]
MAVRGTGMRLWNTTLAVTLALGVSMCGAVLSGCASQKTSTADSSRSTYLSLYNRGEYAEAYKEASKVAISNTTAGEFEQAALIAGESAHALKRYEDAQRWLIQVKDSPSRQVSGHAMATLGLIDQQYGCEASAAELLSRGAAKLGSDDAARAYLFAGDSYSRLGQKDSATEVWEKARLLVKYDSNLRTTIGARLAGGQVPSGTSGAVTTVTGSGTGAGKKTTTGSGGWTLQAGAFSTLSRAVDRSKQLASVASKAGLPAPRAVMTRDKTGKVVYAVRIGNYPSKQAADAVKGRLGVETYVTEATGE